MKTTPDWQFDSGTVTESWVKTRLTARILLYLAFINILIVAAAPLARYYLQTPGFLTFRVMVMAILFGLLLGLASLVILAIALIKNISPAGKNCFYVFLLGIIPPLVLVARVGPEAVQRPMIHDITTDISDPPQFIEVRNLRSPGENSTEYAGASTAHLQELAYPEIQPIITNLDRNAALEEATQVVKDLQWEFINVDYNEGIIEAYDTTPLFGFVDDVIIRVRSEGRGSRVDVRSASRVGQGDLGMNAQRIRLFIATFRG